MEPLASESILLESVSIRLHISIDFVSEDRISYRCEVHSDLVCAPREEIDLEKSICIFYISSIAKLCFSNFWTQRIICRHFFAIIRISSDERFDIAFLVFYYSDDECEIGLLYSSFCDFLLESMHRFIVFCDDDESTGILIEAVYDTRTFYTIYDRRILIYRVIASHS